MQISPVPGTMLPIAHIYWWHRTQKKIQITRKQLKSCSFWKLLDYFYLLVSKKLDSSVLFSISLSEEFGFVESILTFWWFVEQIMIFFLIQRKKMFTFYSKTKKMVTLYTLGKLSRLNAYTKYSQYIFLICQQIWQKTNTLQNVRMQSERVKRCYSIQIDRIQQSAVSLLHIHANVRTPLLCAGVLCCNCVCALVYVHF